MFQIICRTSENIFIKFWQSDKNNFEMKENFRRVFRKCWKIRDYFQKKNQKILRNFEKI